MPRKNFLFALGIFLGFLLAGGLTWAQIEASFYGFPHYSDRPLSGFSCPRLMTRQEQAELRLKIRNPGQVPLRQMIGIEISAPGPLISKREVISLAPGEEKELTWTISAEQNLDLGRFIFARAYRYPTYLGPMAQATCGILVLNLPGSGKILLPLWILLVGISLLPRLRRMEDLHTSQEVLMFRSLALVTAVALLAGLAGWWPLGLLFLTVQIVLSVVILARWLARP